MNWLHKIHRKVQGLFQKQKLDAEMDEEMRTHIEMRTREHIQAGMPPDHARHAAMRQFGWMESIKETCREQRGVTWLEHLIQDLGYGARMLRKNPGFTAVAILALAIGIAVNTAIFTAYNAVALRPIQATKPGSLVNVHVSTLADRYGARAFSYPDYVHYRDHNNVFSGLIAASGTG